MKGILFKPDMIKAIVEGRKTVTRRLGGLKEINQEPDAWMLHEYNLQLNVALFENLANAEMLELKPRYQIGDIVYIKEAFTYVTLAEKDPWKDRAIKDGSFRRKPDGSPVTMCYKLDGYEIGSDWLNPRGMPAWAARYFVQITGVRAERLQEITEEDAVKEGVDYWLESLTNRQWDRAQWQGAKFAKLRDFRAGFVNSKDSYAVLWDSINGEGDYAKNKWVWVYSFKLVPRPDKWG